MGTCDRYLIKKNWVCINICIISPMINFQVKVDSKTRTQLDKYKEQKKIEKEVLVGSNLKDYDIEEDDNTKVVTFVFYIISK